MPPFEAAAPQVAVIVPVRNRKDKTLRFLERFHRQSWRGFHIFVVDSASTDGTPEALREAFPGVTVLAATDEDYWTGATNIGVRAALAGGYEYVLTINDDSIILDRFLESLLALAQRHRTPILGCRIDYMDRPGLVWSIGASHQWGTANVFGTNYGGVREEDLPPLVRDAEILPVESLPGNGVLIHRSVFERVGLYNERFTPHYHADTEFMLRARTRGLVPMATPQVIVYNDFDAPEPQLVGLKPSLRDLARRLFRKRSHWYALPHLYIILRYCPFGLKLATGRRYLWQVYRFSFGNQGLGCRLRHFLRRTVRQRWPGPWRRLRGWARLAVAAGRRGRAGGG